MKTIELRSVNPKNSLFFLYHEIKLWHIARR